MGWEAMHARYLHAKTRSKGSLCEFRVTLNKIQL